MIEMMEFEEILKMAKSHGLTETDLVILSKSSMSTISQYKSGKRKIPDKYRLLLTYIVRDYANELVDDKYETKVCYEYTNEPNNTKELEYLKEEVKFLRSVIKTLMKDS